MDFTKIVPQIQPWVTNLEKVWPAPIIKPQFAFWEVLHIVSLFMLAGALIAINLRLLGVGLVKETPSTIEKNVRPWLHIGVWGALITGILIGMTNAQKLYESNAFLPKMIAMVAAIAFTFAVTTRVAKADGEMTKGVKIGLFASLAVWVFSLLVFALTGGINPGTIHIITGGALLVFVSLSGKTRVNFTAGLLGILALQQVVTHLVIKPDNYALLDPVNKGFTATEMMWVLAFAAIRILGPAGKSDMAPLTRLAAYASLLMWVTVGAAGRWIAFAV
jgi:hypothetical protein